MDDWDWDQGWDIENDAEWLDSTGQGHSASDYDAYASWLWELADEFHHRNPDPKYLTLLCPAPENIMDLLHRSLTIYSIYSDLDCMVCVFLRTPVGRALRVYKCNSCKKRGYVRHGLCGSSDRSCLVLSWKACTCAIWSRLHFHNCDFHNFNFENVTFSKFFFLGHIRFTQLLFFQNEFLPFDFPAKELLRRRSAWKSYHVLKCDGS